MTLKWKENTVNQTFVTYTIIINVTGIKQFSITNQLDCLIVRTILFHPHPNPAAFPYMDTTVGESL